MTIDLWRPVRLIMTSGEDIRYERLADLSFSLSVKANIIHNAIRKGRYIAGYSVRAVYDDGMPIDYVSEEYLNRNEGREDGKGFKQNAKPVKAIYPDGTEEVFSSINAAARAIEGASAGSISTVLRNGGTSGGVRFERIEDRYDNLPA